MDAWRSALIATAAGPAFSLSLPSTDDHGQLTLPAILDSTPTGKRVRVFGMGMLFNLMRQVKHY